MNFDRLFEKAKAAGIEDIQVYFSGGTQFDVNVLNQLLEKYTIADTARLSVKGIFNKKMGTVTTEIINEDVFDFIIESIISSANNIDSEDEVFIYAGDKEYPEVKGLFNEDLETVSVKKKLDDTFELERLTMNADERMKMVQAYYFEGKTNVLIQNSKGLKLEKTVNSAAFYVNAIATDGEDQRTAFELSFNNDYSDFNIQELAKRAAKNATALLGAKPCDSGEYEIVLTSDASTALLQPFSGMFSAESVQKGLSLIADKVDQKIANSNITLVDDPFKAKSPRSGSFDDEGVATTYKELIKDGVLTGFLHNLKTAKIANTKSTGNATNSGVAASNLYIQPGSLSYDDAVASMKKGLVITDLAGTHAGANSVSGDFSLQAAGFLVEDGKILSPVALITVAGNYLDLLQNVTGVCNDLEFNHAFIGSPSLRIKSLVVSGK